MSPLCRECLRRASLEQTSSFKHHIIIAHDRIRTTRQINNYTCTRANVRMANTTMKWISSRDCIRAFSILPACRGQISNRRLTHVCCCFELIIQFIRIVTSNYVLATHRVSGPSTTELMSLDIGNDDNKNFLPYAQSRFSHISII